MTSINPLASNLRSILPQSAGASQFAAASNSDLTTSLFGSNPQATSRANANSALMAGNLGQNSGQAFNQLFSIMISLFSSIVQLMGGTPIQNQVLSIPEQTSQDTPTNSTVPDGTLNGDPTQSIADTPANAPGTTPVDQSPSTPVTCMPYPSNPADTPPPSAYPPADPPSAYPQPADPPPVAYPPANPPAAYPPADPPSAYPQPADPPPVACPPANPPSPPPSYGGGSGGKYYGDPHFNGFDGEKYDVMGTPGQIYNVLSDKGIQYNAQFDKWGNKGATIISKAGLEVGKSQVAMDRTGAAPTVNGKAMKVGQTVKLDGGTATWDGKKLTVSTPEYTTTLFVQGQNNPQGTYLNSTVQINPGANPLADGVAPHGLLGQTADGVAGAHKGVNNTGDLKQGGTVIDGTINDYQVSSLFDTKFKKFNRFN